MRIPCSTLLVLLSACSTATAAQNPPILVGPGCPHLQLDSALDEAEIRPGPDIVLVTAGEVISRLINSPDPLEIVGATHGCNGSPVGPVVLSGRSAPINGSILRIAGKGNVTLRNLTLQGGRGTSVGGEASRGGAILHRGTGALRLEEVTVRSSTAVYGSAIYVGGLGALEVVNSSVRENLEPGWAIEFSSPGMMAILDSALSNNYRGVLVSHASSVDVLGTLFEHNAYALRVSDVPQVAITDSAFSGHRWSGIEYRGHGTVVFERSGISATGDPVAGTFGPGLQFTALGDDAMLTIEHSPITGNGGGGIRVSGGAAVSLRDTLVIGNRSGAAPGGGIAVQGGMLRLGPGVEIADNTTGYAGGGIHLKEATLDAVHAVGLLIARNEAKDEGGGIAIVDSDARIGSGRVTGTITGNRTLYSGGGIAVVGDSSLQVMTTSSSAPITIGDNVAGSAGGGIVVGLGTGTDIQRVALYDTRVDDNRAQMGAGIFVLAAADVAFCMGRTADPRGCPVEFGEVPVEAVACPIGTICNSISGNRSTDAVFPLGSALISVGLDAGRPAWLSGVRISDNIGDSTLVASHGLELRDAIVSQNLALQGPLFGLFPAIPEFGPLTIRNSTIAFNFIDASYVLAPLNDITLLDSIIFQPGKVVHPGGAAGVVASNVIANEVATIGPSNSVLALDPLLVEVDNGDVLLAADSPAIDFAPAVGPSWDIHGNRRGIDDPARPDRFGSLDLGAVERPTAAIFTDGFE
jgi:hypothetical protein